MWKMFNYKLKYVGLNFSSFLNYLIKNNIKIFNVNKDNSKEIYFEISNKEYRRFKSLKSNYLIHVEKLGGVKPFFKNVLKRLGLFIGITLILIYSIVYNNRIVLIKVIGSEYANKIIDAMKNYGIEVGGINKFNNEEVEKYLLDNIDEISLVSIKKQGNIIVVNSIDKEEKYENFDPYYAPYNMVIKDVKLISGTLNVSKNDVIKKGEILVEPFAITSTGNRVDVPANAVIVADIWFCGSEIAMKENIIFEKTGNKTTYNNVNFINKKEYNHLSPYTHFVTETYNNNITNNYFLPIYLLKTTFYETQQKVVKFDFENEKKNYLEKSKQKAYTILPKNVTIQEITQNVSELSDRYVFQTYLKTTMELMNEN